VRSYPARPGGPNPDGGPWRRSWSPGQAPLVWRWHHRSDDPRWVIVLFDLDGTVWDSERGIIGCMEHAFTALGLAVPPREVLESNVGPPLEVMLRDVGMPEELVDEGVLAYRDRYRTWGAFQADPYAGMPELLDELGGAGIRLATATSKGEEPTHLMLDHFGLARHFEVVGAATMDTTATTKERVLGRALAALGDPDPEQCVMIGDRHYDVEGAASHGIRCIGVSWGYGHGTELVDAGAAAVVHSPAELRDELLGSAAQGVS
jgi:phosphoglycolate phosphatase